MGWIVAAGLLVLLLAFLFWRFKTGTFFYMHGSALIALRGYEDEPAHVSLEQFRRAVELLVAGEPFDNLWMSFTDDQYAGIVVSSSDHIQLDVDFKTEEEAQALGSFREKMAAAGYLPVEEVESYTGQSRIKLTTLEYRLPKDAETAREACLTALSELQGGPTEGIYLLAWRTADVPSAKRGISYRKRHDLLKDIV